MFKKPTHSFVKPQAVTLILTPSRLAVLAEVLGTALLANAVAMGTDALHVGLTLAALVF